MAFKMAHANSHASESGAHHKDLRSCHGAAVSFPSCAVAHSPAPERRASTPSSRPIREPATPPASGGGGSLRPRGERAGRQAGPQSGKWMRAGRPATFRGVTDSDGRPPHRPVLPRDGREGGVAHAHLPGRREDETSPSPTTGRRSRCAVLRHERAELIAAEPGEVLGPAARGGLRVGAGTARGQLEDMAELLRHPRGLLVPGRPRAPPGRASGPGGQAPARDVPPRGSQRSRPCRTRPARCPGGVRRGGPPVVVSSAVRAGWSAAGDPVTTVVRPVRGPLFLSRPATAPRAPGRRRRAPRRPSWVRCSRGPRR